VREQELIRKEWEERKELILVIPQDGELFINKGNESRSITAEIILNYGCGFKGRMEYADIENILEKYAATPSEAAPHLKDEL
jgi:hypothetical protein